MKKVSDRLEAAVNLAIRIAAGDLDARLLPSDAGDDVDALIASLNMLAEELTDERRTRARAEGLLADEIDTYERAPALFCSLDAETLVVEKCNRTLAESLDIPKEKILGTSILDLCPQSGRAEAEKLLRRCEIDSAPSHGDLILLTAANRAVTMAAGISRIRVGDRERLRIVGKDVTTEKNLEIQLMRAQKMEAVGRLAGGVAHDFNNILSVAMTAAEFLRDDLIAHQLPTDDVQLILDATFRGAALTRDLLAFSRQGVVRPVPTDLRACVRDTERMVARLVGAQIRVVTTMVSEPTVCLIDPSQVSQVLLNLAINGRDAMPNGGTLGLEVSRVDLDASDTSDRLDVSPGPYALIAVSDSGVGMSPEIAAQAFEPFFTTKAVGQGTGLGLSMCYGIIRQAGGRISIYSEPGRGTTINIYLPLVDHVAHGESARSPAIDQGSETVLVVEDDAGIRALAKRILVAAGYNVLVASNGREALDVVGKLDGDLALVVTDVTMPEMNGRDLAIALETIRPKTRVLYVSGFTANVVVAQGILKPGIAFMAKPFTAAALLAAIRQVLDQREG